MAELSEIATILNRNIRYRKQDLAVLQLELNTLNLLVNQVTEDNLEHILHRLDEDFMIMPPFNDPNAEIVTEWIKKTIETNETDIETNLKELPLLEEALAILNS